MLNIAVVLSYEGTSYTSNRRAFLQTKDCGLNNIEKFGGRGEAVGKWP